MLVMSSPFAPNQSLLPTAGRGTERRNDEGWSESKARFSLPAVVGQRRL